MRADGGDPTGFELYLEIGCKKTDEHWNSI
jgi:hypothetical protein